MDAGMRRPVTDRQEECHPRIARALFWTSMVMLLLSLYEIGVRWSDLSGELRMVSRMVQRGRLTWGEFVFTYMWDLNSFSVAGYMGLRALLAIWALAARCRRQACFWMILPAALLTALGFTLKTGLFSEMFKLLSMLPLLLFLLLCMQNVCMRSRRKPGPRQNPHPGPLRDGRPVR